jgi:hypothetical protein
MLQTNRISPPIRKDVGVFREKSGKLLIDAADQLLIDRDPDENGIDAFCRGVDSMQRAPLVSSILPIFFPARKILLDNDFAVFDNDDAVNVFGNCCP